MKGNKKDQPPSILDRYLTWKHFSDESNSQPKNLSIEQMTLYGTVQAHSGSQNCIKFSVPDAGFFYFTEEYSKLIDFISEAPEPYKSQLSFLAYPMFVHFYLELITCGKMSDAQQFYSCHNDLFMDTAGYEDAVRDLAAILNPQDLSNHIYFKMFREEKCDVKINQDCKEYLFRFLKDSKCAPVMQFVAAYFNLMNEDSEFIETRSDCISSDVLPQTISEETKTQMSTLDNAFERQNSEPVSLPSLYVYCLDNHPQVLCNADISASNKFLVGSYEDNPMYLWNFHQPPDDVEPNPTPIHGHNGTAYGLCFLPNEDFWLSCSEDTTVRLWSTSTLKNVHIYSGHCYPVWDVAVSSFQFHFASASCDQTARLWDFERSYPLRLFAGHKSDVSKVKFHPNSTYIATGSSDSTVRLWSIHDGRMVRVFTGHKGDIMALAFSPNGQMLASAAEDRKIKIWDLGSGNEVKELEGHCDTVSSLSFNDDGSLLASGGMDENVKIWDMQKTQTNDPKAKDSSCLASSFSTRCAGHTTVRFGYKNLLVAIGVSEIN